MLHLTFHLLQRFKFKYTPLCFSVEKVIIYRTLEYGGVEGSHIQLCVGLTPDCAHELLQVVLSRP